MSHPLYDATDFEIVGAPAGGELSYSDEGMRRIARSFPKEQRTCTLRVGIAAGPWTTVAQAWTATPRPGKLALIFGWPRAFNGGTAIAVSHTPTALCTRLVAIDGAGQTHHPVGGGKLGTDSGPSGPAVGSVDGGAAHICQLEAEFSVPPERLSAFQFQTCQKEWAEFRDVHLFPTPAK